jgi:hypothetical protein
MGLCGRRLLHDGHGGSGRGRMLADGVDSEAKGIGPAADRVTTKGLSARPDGGGRIRSFRLIVRGLSKATKCAYFSIESS